MKTRVISGIVIAVLAVVLLVLGGDVLFASLLLISLIGLYELYHVVKIQNRPLGIVGYITTAAYFFMARFQKEEYVMFLLILFLMVLMAVYVFTFPEYSTEQVIMGFFGFVYVSVMLSYIYKVRILEDGIFVVWLIFICSWVCDTCAYAVGMCIGKHRLAPVLSPKKSIEGAVGGIAGSALVGVIYACVLAQFESARVTSFINPYIGFALVGAIGAVISQIGDLAASAIKRNHGVKDYGKLIPGHGGILDRFDSVIFTAPAIYFLIRFIH
jgi:phosphatidate cytidylyltransferase